VPVTLSFDIQGASPNQRNRLQSMFERFGWQDLDGSSYRYPTLEETPYAEDWFNHVIPALMLFRTYVLESGMPLTKLSLDVQSSTGYFPSKKFGTAPKASSDIKFYKPTKTSFGLKNLSNGLTLSNSRINNTSRTQRAYLAQLVDPRVSHVSDW
jgi:hypothetical protein